MDKKGLIDFEKWTKRMFLQGKLRSPVHLSGGNEDELITIFKQIKKEDWVFTTYRSHYHALLKGVPIAKLKKWVLDNKSIHFMDAEYNVVSSAIVGGTLPIALGVAYGLKTQKKAGTVYCFIGDMTASLGVFNDCLTYAINFNLPIVFVIENNGMSTDSKTSELWGIDEKEMDRYFAGLSMKYDKVISYNYKRTYPHYGVGKFVKFK